MPTIPHSIPPISIPQVSIPQISIPQSNIHHIPQSIPQSSYLSNFFNNATNFINASTRGPSINHSISSNTSHILVVCHKYPISGGSLVPISIPIATFILGTSHVQRTTQFISGAQHIHQFASPPNSTQDALLKEIRDLKNMVQIIQ